MDRTLGAVVILVTGHLALMVLSLMLLVVDVPALVQAGSFLALVLNGALLSTYSWPQLRARLSRDHS